MIFAFYGTLRKNQPNYNRFGLEKAGKFLGTHIVPGFIMVDLGWYPMVFGSTSADDTIVVDLVEISDEHICNSIEGMERGAGYANMKVDVDGKTAHLYVADPRWYKNPKEKIVPSGDWVKYNTETKHASRKTY